MICKLLKRRENGNLHGRPVEREKIRAKIWGRKVGSLQKGKRDEHYSKNKKNSLRFVNYEKEKKLLKVINLKALKKEVYKYKKPVMLKISKETGNLEVCKLGRKSQEKLSLKECDGREKGLKTPIRKVEKKETLQTMQIWRR